MFYIDRESKICNFADDTTINACETTVEAVITKLEGGLQKLVD